MVNGGSAIQLFKGLDTRQFKVSVDSSQNSSMNFNSVLSEKRSSQIDSQSSQAQSRSDEKLNKQDMTSEKRPKVRDANKTESSTREDSKVNTDKQDALSKTENESKVDSKDEAKDASKEASELKALLKKLGLSEEEAAQFIEMIPEDVMAEFAALMQNMPTEIDLTLQPEVAMEELALSMESLTEMLQDVLADMSQSSEVSSELIESLEMIQAKVESAMQNLEGMTTEEFATVLTAVQTEVEAESTLQSTVEVVEVNINDTVTDGDSSEGVPDVVIAQGTESGSTTEEESSDGDEDESSTSNEPQGVDVKTSETTAVQVDQTTMEESKIESSVIKSTQPMEQTSSRVRLSQEIMNQVMQGSKLQLNPTENGQQIILRLRPEELGNVNLKISVENGILMAEFNVENQTVKEVLESNMSDLKQALSEKGYGIEGMQVSVGQEQSEQKGQFDNMFYAKNARRNYFFSTDEETQDFEAINKSLAGLQSSFEYYG